MAPIAAPTTEIGYTQTPNYNWWLYENETTPELIWPMSVYVYDQMRRQDAQVGSVLRAVTETLLRTPWRIDPAGARPRVVKFVADDLGLPVVGKQPTAPPRLKDRFSWPTHLREALLMLPLGHSYFEQVYRVTPDGSAAHLRKLAYRPAKTIERIDVAPDGGLIAIKQWWTTADRQPEPIPVNRLVAYIHAKEGGNWLGTSILRNCYKNWLLKDRLLRVQAQTIERNGMGIPLYTANESETDLSAGLSMATKWRAGEAAGSAIPFGASLKLVGVEGTLPDAEPAIRYHDEQIARAVLAHFLNLGTQTGSWALGSTFADFFVMSLQTLAEQIRDTATSHIIEDLVDINFGENEPAPRLVFDEIGSRQAATALALKTLVDAGVIRPDEVLEESSRQQYGLPPADLATVRTPAAAAAPDMLPAPTATGDLSTAVAATQNPKAGAVEEADLDEEADDWEDAIDALILALDEIGQERVEAAWDPAKHARNPKGSPGGGKFRSMVDRLKDAISEHQSSGGKGHPFESFDREQLRRVAKARGIELKRGEGRDAIATKLLDHLGGKKEKPKERDMKEALKKVGLTPDELGKRPAKKAPPKPPVVEKPKVSKKTLDAKYLSEHQSPVTTLEDPELRESLKGIFEYHDPQTGFSTVLERGEADFGDVLVRLVILDKDGHKVGTSVRHITEVQPGMEHFTGGAPVGSRIVEHSFFALDKRDPPIQGGGFATRWLHAVEEEYRANDVHSITLHADIDVGGYAWAKMGFDFKNPGDAKFIAENDFRFKAQLAHDPATREAAQKLIDRAQAGDMPTPIEFAMVGWAPGKKTWLGKEAMLGSDWQGVKRL